MWVGTFNASSEMDRKLNFLPSGVEHFAAYPSKQNNSTFVFSPIEPVARARVTRVREVRPIDATRNHTRATSALEED